MARRLPFRDPRTVARDIPGVIDVIFPRLGAGLVASFNKFAFGFEGINPLPNEELHTSQIQKSFLFEISVVAAEKILLGDTSPAWNDVFDVALKRQKKHYDFQNITQVTASDRALIELASKNLVWMLESIKKQNPCLKLEFAPKIPGLGWISSGVGDFAIGQTLIEVKHTNRNFGSGDFRQVLTYWLLKYSSEIERDGNVWSEVLLINPRRNSGLLLDFDFILESASNNLSRIEAAELLRSAAERSDFFS